MTEQHTDSKKAMIFDIQHFSVHDGPGIRTTIFFKGCPLRCIWCHNPESYTKEKQLSYKSNLCTGCFECVEVCPTKALTIKTIANRKYLDVDYEKCTVCGACTEVCCYEAMSLVGKEYTVLEVVEKIEKSKQYYSLDVEKIGRGGVTLSGGEPMAQLNFIELLLDELDGAHVCMETSGYAKTKDFLRIAKKIDLFLFDIKATGTEEHRKLTGVGNELILENLDALYKAGAGIVLRLPLIPGVNDSKEHFEHIAELLRKYPDIKRAEIMPYTDYGISKAEMIGFGDKVLQLGSADTTQKEEWLERFRNLDVDCEIG